MATKKTARKKTAPKVTTALNVGVLVDMSGSMSHLALAARAGIDDYIRDLKEDDGADDTFVTLATFDSGPSPDHALRFDVWFAGKPVREIEPMSDRYQPSGGTPLYDATARLISTMDTKLSSDAKNMIVVLTDGFENTSKEFTVDSLKAMVETYEARDNWTFVYLGANDANAKITAGAMGYAPGNAGYFAANEASLRTAMHNVSGQSLGRKYATGMSSSASFAESGVSDDTRDVIKFEEKPSGIFAPADEEDKS